MASAGRRRSVVDMFNESRNFHPDAPRRAALVVLGAVVINAFVFSPLGDEWFFTIALLGPPLSGLVAGVRRHSVRLVAAAWAVSGLFWFVLDWIIHNEDQVFHVVLTLVMVALTALGAQVGRLLVTLTRKLSHPAVPEAR
jgi:hypothetical protein